MRSFLPVDLVIHEAVWLTLFSPCPIIRGDGLEAFVVAEIPHLEYIYGWLPAMIILMVTQYGKPLGMMWYTID